jgi:hypothetical protein
LFLVSNIGILQQEIEFVSLRFFARFWVGANQTNRFWKDISASGSYVNTWVKKNGNWQVVSSVFP